MIYIRKATLCINSTKQTREIQEGKKKTGKIKKIKIKKKTKQQKNYKRERELRKEGRESLVVSLQARDQSKRVPLKDASI